MSGKPESNGQTAQAKKPRAPKPGAKKDQEMRKRQKAAREQTRSQQPKKAAATQTKSESKAEVSTKTKEKPKPSPKPKPNSATQQARQGEGRKIPKEVKDLPVQRDVEGSEYKDLYQHNVYGFDTWFHENKTSAQAKWLCRAQNQKRIPLARPPKNLPEHVASNISRLFAGDGLPLVRPKNFDTTKAHVRAPAIGVILRNMIRCACQAWRNRISGPGNTHVGVVAHADELQAVYDALLVTAELMDKSIVATMYVLARAPMLQRYQHNRVQVIFRIVDPAPNMCTIDGHSLEKEVFPKEIISVLGSASYEMDGERYFTPLTEVLIAAHNSAIVEIAPIKPIGATGTFGNPVAEFSWTARSVHREAVKDNLPATVNFLEAHEDNFSMAWWRDVPYDGFGGIVIQSASTKASFVLGLSFIRPSQLAEDGWVSELSSENTLIELPESSRAHIAGPSRTKAPEKVATHVTQEPQKETGGEAESREATLSDVLEELLDWAVGPAEATTPEIPAGAPEKEEDASQDGGGPAEATTPEIPAGASEEEEDASQDDSVSEAGGSDADLAANLVASVIAKVLAEERANVQPQTIEGREEAAEPQSQPQAQDEASSSSEQERPDVAAPPPVESDTVPQKRRSNAVVAKAPQKEQQEQPDAPASPPVESDTVPQKRRSYAVVAKAPQKEPPPPVESDTVPQKRRSYAVVAKAPQKEPHPHTIAKGPARGAKAAAGGKLDPVIPVQPQSQTRVGVREPTTRFVKGPGDKWFFTRQFVAWLWSQGMHFANKHPIVATVGSCIGVAALSTVASYVPILSRFAPDASRFTLWATGVSCAGLIMHNEVVKPDPDFNCDTGRVIALTREQEGTVTSMISRRVVEGKPLNPTTLSATISDIGRAINYQGNVVELAPLVTARWGEVRRETAVKLGVSKTILAGIVAAEIILRFRNFVYSPIDWIRSRGACSPAITLAFAFLAWCAQKLRELRTWASTALPPGVNMLATLPATSENTVSIVLNKGVARHMVESVFVAPFTEEAVKMGLGRYIGQKKAAWLFAAAEAAQYAFILHMQGWSPRQILLARTTPFLLHVATGYIESYSTRVLVHMAHNVFAVASTLMQGYQPSAVQGSSALVCDLVARWCSASQPIAELGEPAMVVCCAHREVKPVRRGNSVTFKSGAKDTDCKAGKGYYRTGPTLECHQPFSFCGCQHNCLNALTSRMAGVPAAFLEDDSDEARDTVDANILANAHRTVPILQRCAGPFLFYLVGADEWAGRFPAHKRDSLLKAYHNAGKLRREYKTFVKVEKAVTAKEYIDWLKRWSTDGRLSQPGEGVLKLDARGISVPDEALRVETGPWCLALNSAMNQMFRHQILYNPGCTPKETSEWFEWATRAVNAGTLPWAMAVQGDDSLLMFKDETGFNYLSSDMSRYDMCQRVTHFMGCWAFIDRMGISCPDGVREIIEDQQGILGGQRIYHANGFSAKITGTMASGDGVTITFNSLTLMMTIIGWLEAGRPDFGSYMKGLGFVVTHQLTRLNQPLLVDFLQSRPWLTACGERVFAPKPGRILSRFFWIDKAYNSAEKYKTDAQAMAYGLLALSQHVPIINDICRRVIAITGECKHRRITDDGPLELTYWRRGSWEVEHPATELEMAELYGLTVADIQLARQRCRAWEIGEHLDNTAELIRIFSAIATVDLA